MAEILRDGNSVHIFAGTNLVPGAYLGSVACHPAEVLTAAEALKRLGVDGGTRARMRVARVTPTIAQVNAGFTIVAAQAGVAYRMVDCQKIAVGGADTGDTTVDIIGTQAAGAVKLAAFAQAQATQNTVLRPGIAGCAVLAGGASFKANDVNTAITVGVTGAALTTAVTEDIQVLYEEIVTP